MDNMKKIFTVIIISTVIISSVYSEQKSKLQDELNAVLSYYYLKPQPDKIPALLKGLISSEFFNNGKASKNNSNYILAYYFGRIAQLEPALIKKYENLFEEASYEGRILLLKIFQLCGNDQVREFLAVKLEDKDYAKEKTDISRVLRTGIPIEFNPLANEIKGPADLDFLWADFMLSGNEKAVEKIISVLDWPDRARLKLDNYLKNSVPSVEKKEIIQILDNEFYVKCDILDSLIITQDDLDIAIALNLQKQKIKSQSFQRLNSVLGLSNEDIFYLATKGSSYWSLNSNATQHKKVFEICDAGIEKHSGSAKIALVRISAYGYMADGDVNKAIGRLKQLITLNPQDAWGHFSLGALYVKNKDLENAGLEIKNLEGLNEPLAAELSKEIEALKRLTGGAVKR